MPIATPSSAPPPPAEPQVPFPARFWWLKRLSTGTLLLVLLLGSVRAAWGWEADRRLRDALSAAAARGEPVDVAGLALPDLPDDSNAAWYVRKSADAVDPNADSPAATAMTWPDYPPFNAWWHRTARRSVAANRKSSLLARQARAHDGFDWDTSVTFPAVTKPSRTAEFNNLRHLANTLGDAAVFAHLQGDDEAALETVRDLRHAGRGVGTQPLLVGNLVFVGIDALAMDRLQKIATGLRIAPYDGPPPSPYSTLLPPALPRAQPPAAPRPVTRSNVRALVADLLDERDVIESLNRAIVGERAMAVDAAGYMGDMAPLTAPMFRLDTARAVNGVEAVRDAAAEPTVPASYASLARSAAQGTLPAPNPAATAALAGGPPPPAGARPAPVDYSRLITTVVGGAAYGRLIEQNLRVRAARRMTAISLAAHLYRADHGAWPESLEQLVPNYLPEVPRDPLANDHAPFRYMLVKGALPGGADRPVVYSAGRNGTWETVGPGLLPPTPSYGWTPGADLYNDLTTWVPPAAAPATRPATAPTTSPAGR